MSAIWPAPTAPASETVYVEFAPSATVVSPAIDQVTESLSAIVSVSLVVAPSVICGSLEDIESSVAVTDSVISAMESSIVGMVIVADV